MRGSDRRSGELLSYVSIEERIRADHPLRTIREIVNEALGALSGDFEALYAGMGRPSIPPEMLLRAALLQAFYSIRSERQLMERLEFDLLFRWFLGLSPDEPAWDHSSFSKNRDRLLAGEIAATFLTAVLARPRVKRLLSTGGDPPADAPGGGASRNADVDFKGQRRTNDTHRSTTDAEAKLYRKGRGREAKLCFMGHALMENRSDLRVDACLTLVSGRAERLAALEMIDARADRAGRVTLGADKGYEAADFVAELRELNVVPHVARTRAGGFLRSMRARRVMRPIA